MKLLPSLTLSALLPALAHSQITGTYTQISPSLISPNPSSVNTWIYLPKTLAPNPPVLVVPHWCHGSAAAAYQGSPFTYAADAYGFIVLYPDSPNAADKCWDVSSNSTLAHEGGGDSLGIVSAVRYVLERYGGDRRRVFVQGTSSGAMMTNVLLGAYPDLFAAGSAWAGVAFGCFQGPSVDYWNGDCAEGMVDRTGVEWKALVDKAYPGYTGWRPKFQVFHGDKDNVLYPPNLEQEVKQWTAVLGLGPAPDKVEKDTPLAGWTKRTFGGGRFEATLAAGVDHNIQTQLDTVMQWFDLKCTGTKCFGRPDVGSGGASSTTLKTSTTAKTSSKTSTTAKTSSKTTKVSTKSSSTSKISTKSSSTSVQTTSILTTTSSVVVSTTTTSAATSTISSSCAMHWGQCGGDNWTGPRCCETPYTCTYLNQWHYQCL